MDKSEAKEWYVRLQQARHLLKLGDEAGFLREALSAFNQHPQRGETLYDLARFFREKSMYHASVLFSKPGLGMKRPEQDTVFLEDFVYTRGLREEYSIAANYARESAIKEQGHAICEWLALSRNVPTQSRDLARRNLVFYARPLGEIAPSFAVHPIAFSPPPGWSACNPGLTRWRNKFWCVIRSSNHKLHDDGRFTAPPDEYVKTRNYLAQLNDDLAVTSVDEIAMPADWPVPLSPRTQGFEDCRLFVWKDELWVSATVSELTPQGWCEIALARIQTPAQNPRFADWRVLTPAGPKRNEKNWMPWVEGGLLRFVYFVDPVRVLDDKAHVVHESLPAFSLDHLRGGYPLLAFDGGWLTVTHEVATLDAGVRRYLHRWIWFDRDGTVQRISDAFCLLQCEIEYAGGIVWHPDEKRLVMCFGRWDREAWISTVSAADVRRLLTQIPGAQGPVRMTDISDFLIRETNHALRTALAVEDAVALAEASGWMLHPTRYKVWETVLAVGHALMNLPLNAAILDAGSEMNSPFLHVLQQHGFRHLTGINLLFTRPEMNNGVMYRPGDITSTGFQNGAFDFIACLSVLQHGVDVPKFFREMVRILLPDGLLFVSFDYWADPVDTGNRVAYGVPVCIFSRKDAEALIDHASQVGLIPIGGIDLFCKERVIHWDGLEYTFANLLFRRS